ncbi:hypothetical protein Tco_1243793, partial [Tanacetum coccineum]
TVMSSDSASSEVTYASISSHGDPLAWEVDFFRLQEPDSPEAAPASPDYVPGPEEPEQAPLSPDYVPGPEYPEYLAPSDEEVLVEDQPYAVADSPIALSPGYVADSDLEEDSEDGPVDYPADGGDGNDDDSSDDDEEEEEASEEEEDEHLAPADSVVAPVVDHVPSSEETEPFETDESAATPPSPPACHTTARISIRPEAPMPFPSEEEVERLLALPSPPPSPLSPWSSPLPQIPSPPLPPPLSSLQLPPPIPTSLPLPSSPLPPLPASLFIPPLVDRREDTPEAELPPCKRLCLTALTSRYEVGESSTAAPRPTTTTTSSMFYHLLGLGGGEFNAAHRHAGGSWVRTMGLSATLDAEKPDIREDGGRLLDLRDVCCESTRGLGLTQLFQKSMDWSRWKFYYETARLLDQEDLVSHEAWAYSVGLSSAVHYELQAYMTHTQMQDFRKVISAAWTDSALKLEVRLMQMIARVLNNMPPRRSSATARDAAAARAAAAAAAPMTAVVVE